MIKVAIVEDDISCSDELKSFFDRYQEEVKCPIEVDVFENADNFLADYKAGSYQMVFMDIEMPGTDGMEASKILRTKDNDVLLVFVTNLSQYALESYEVQAFNFMVKPIVYNDFIMKMERAIQRIKKNADVKISVFVKIDDDVIEKFIIVSTIRYIEVFDHNLIYHTTQGDIVAIRRDSMDVVSKKLEPFGFLMCNKSFLINLKYITAVAKDDVHINDEVIKISRRKRNEFLQAVAQYISFG